MTEIRNIRVPPLIPGMEGQSIEERHAETWEFQQGSLRFNFVDGRILLNNQDLLKLISANIAQLSTAYWSDVAHKLENYRRWALRFVRDPEQLAMFSAFIQAVLGRIGGKIKRRFDEKIDGIAFELGEDGQLLLNGVNIHSFLEMSRKYPTQKTKIFLKGLKNRLGILLSNRFGNPNYEKIRGVVEDLFAQIDQEISKSSPDIVLLPPASGK